MRLDGVEVKVSIGGPDVATAIRALGLGADGQPRGVGFIEDTTVGVALPLFHQGIVLRVRQERDEEGDATVKLRPCRRSQLGESWLGQAKGPGFKLRIEEDWAGPRRVLAASCVADLERDLIAAVQAGSEPPQRLFTEPQRRFLADGAGIPINLDALTLLPLIDATRWGKREVQGVEDVVAERWRVGDLDFLELSLRTDDAEQATAAQAQLEQGIRAIGLEPDDDRSKTERVLTHLTGLGG
jgi:hypothetical protein